MARTSPMPTDHRHAISEARQQSFAVRRYLHALDRPRPGRNPDTIRARLDELASLNGTGDPVTRLHRIQRRIDLEAQLAAAETGDDLETLEDDFVAVAADFAARKGISYSAFREGGVPARVLRRAGITRGS